MSDAVSDVDAADVAYGKLNSIKGNKHADIKLLKIR